MSVAGERDISYYRKHKQSYENYRRKIRRFTLQFSLQDKEVLEWFEQQPNKGLYLKMIILEDKWKKQGECTLCSKTD